MPPHHHHGGHHHGGHSHGGFVNTPILEGNYVYNTPDWYQIYGLDGQCYWCNRITGQCYPCNPHPSTVQKTGIYEGEMIPPRIQWPYEMVGADIVEPAGLNLPWPGTTASDVRHEKDYLGKYVQSTNSSVAVNAARIPANLITAWSVWQVDFLKFYSENPIYLSPTQPGADLDRAKKYEAEFANLQNELAKYADVSPMINPAQSPSAVTPGSGGGLLGGVAETTGKAFDMMKWGLIIGAVVLGAVAIANIKSGGRVVEKML